MFGWLGLQGQYDVSSVRNIFEGSLTEYGMGSGKATFEGGFKFEYFEERKNFDNTDSEYQGAIW